MRSLLVILLFPFILTVVGPVADSFAVTLPDRPPVTLRMGKHEGFIRFVFDMPAEFVEKAKVSLQRNRYILLDLSAPVAFRIGYGDFVSPLSDNEKTVRLGNGVEVRVKEQGCLIHADTIAELKIHKLQAPPRLIVDAYSQAAPADAGSSGSEPAGTDVYVIDPGHGGYDRGIQTGGQREKDLALAVAVELASAISREGGETFLTRKGDMSLSLSSRIMTAKKKSPAMLISIHLSSQKGVTIYAPAFQSETGKSRSRQDSSLSVQIIGLTKRLAQAFRDDLGLEARTERLPLPLLEEVGVPAVLVELPNPSSFAYDQKSVRKIAGAIAKVIGPARENRGNRDEQ